MATALLAWTLTRPGPRPAHSPKRLNLDLSLPSTASLSPFLAISPDGTQLVFSANSGGRPQLYVRPMDKLKTTPLPGTEGAQLPFFSPDGEWLGFFTDGKLKKTQIGAKEPVTLCDAPAGRGASWGIDGTILFAPHPSAGLYRVPAIGGAAQRVTTPGRDEFLHVFPEVLPGGKAALFAILRLDLESSIAVLSLETGRWRVLVPGRRPHYAAGVLLFTAPKGSIMAAPFDVERLELRGAAVPVLEDVGVSGMDVGDLAVSRSGALAYSALPKQRAGRRTLVLVDRRGKEETLPQSERSYSSPVLSPDGHRIAVEVSDPDTGSQLWLSDQTRGTWTPWTRLTFEGDNSCPVWSPDGTRVMFRSVRNGITNLFWVPADGSGGAEPLTQNWDLTSCRTSFSPDGKVIAFDRLTPATGLTHIEILPVGGKPESILTAQFDTRQARFAPNGRWLAYVSNESGRYEVYVRPYPGPGKRWQVSTNGGSEPRWSRNGQELFYRDGDKLIAATLRTEPDFSAGSPQVLFVGSFETEYDVSPDGQRFVMIKRPERAAVPPNQLVVVPDWFDELDARLHRAAK